MCFKNKQQPILYIREEEERMKRTSGEDEETEQSGG